MFIHLCIFIQNHDTLFRLVRFASAIYIVTKLSFLADTPAMWFSYYFYLIPFISICKNFKIVLVSRYYSLITSLSQNNCSNRCHQKRFWWRIWWYFHQYQLNSITDSCLPQIEKSFFTGSNKYDLYIELLCISMQMGLVPIPGCC